MMFWSWLIALCDGVSSGEMFGYTNETLDLLQWAIMKYNGLYLEGL